MREQLQIATRWERLVWAGLHLSPRGPRHAARSWNPNSITLADPKRQPQPVRSRSSETDLPQ